MSAEKQPREAWLVQEMLLLKQHYERPIPMTEIMRMLPRHPRGSIREFANKQLGLKRPRGIRDNGHAHPAWDRIKALIAVKPMTRDEIGDQIGVTKQAVAEVLSAHRKEWFVSDWEPPVGRGKPTEKLSLGDADNVPYPRRSRCRKLRSIRAIDPFLVAAGAIKAPKAPRGRIIKNLRDDDLEEAA